MGAPVAHQILHFLDYLHTSLPARLVLSTDGSIIVLFLSLSGCGWLRIGGCCDHFVVVLGNILVGCGYVHIVI